MATEIDERSDRSWGTVILPFGRYFAGRVDLLTRERFKAIEPVTGVSPFAAAGDPDPRMRRFAEARRVNARATADIRKDFGALLENSGAHYLVVDNSTALLPLREHNRRSYTLVGGEATDLMDLLWNRYPGRARKAAIWPAYEELTPKRQAAYDAFVSECARHFDAEHIVLLRSHVPRFFMSAAGTLAPTNSDPRDAQLLETLDGHFARRTGCRVSTAALRCFPVDKRWHSFDDTLHVSVEDDLVDLCAPEPRRGARGGDRVAARGETAADHVIRSLRGQCSIDPEWLRTYFADGGATHDDFLALAFIGQRNDQHESLVRECVEVAVADAESLPSLDTRQRFDRSLDALRDWEWCAVDVPPGDLWIPHVAVESRGVVFRFHADGSIERVQTSPVTEAAVDRIVSGALSITPLNLYGFIGSWPTYVERGRRGITAAPTVTVSDATTLVDSCYWIDWEWVLANESMVVATPGTVRPNSSTHPAAKTDLSFFFAPNARIGTVGGGLMDQLTHIALYDDLCAPHGLDYYLDDFRYIWWRSHNGFEASRLAPNLESKRISRLVSQALVDRFRAEVSNDVKNAPLPWVYNQSNVWHKLGLRGAIVVTRNHPNSRRLIDAEPVFPVLIYTTDEQLRQLIEEPPAGLRYFTTQHKSPMSLAGSSMLRRVFSFDHLEDEGLSDVVARTAERLRVAPHVALHIRRGDYLHPAHDRGGWYSERRHYLEAIKYLADSEFGGSTFNVAVFSDDLAYVEEHRAEYGLDLVPGDVLFVRGNQHFDAIFDSYLMSLCPVVVGSVGFFAATTALLADPPNAFMWCRPGGVRVAWRRAE